MKQRHWNITFKNEKEATLHSVLLHHQVGHSAETLDMHSTGDDHRRHFCQVLKKKAGSPNRTHGARSDSCIRQCGPSTTARLCLQYQYTGNNPTLTFQLYAEQTSQS